MKTDFKRWYIFFQNVRTSMVLNKQLTDEPVKWIFHIRKRETKTACTQMASTELNMPLQNGFILAPKYLIADQMYESTDSSKESCWLVIVGSIFGVNLCENRICNERKKEIEITMPLLQCEPAMWNVLYTFFVRPCPLNSTAISIQNKKKKRPSVHSNYYSECDGTWKVWIWRVMSKFCITFKIVQTIGARTSLA